MTHVRCTKCTMSFRLYENRISHPSFEGEWSRCYCGVLHLSTGGGGNLSMISVKQSEADRMGLEPVSS